MFRQIVLDPRATPQAKAKEKDSEALADDRHKDVGQWKATPKKLRRMKRYEVAKLKGVAPKTICDWENRPDVIARAAFLTRMSKERGQIIVWREWPNIIEMQTDQALGGHDWSAEFCKEVGFTKEQVQVAAAQANASISFEQAVKESLMDDDNDSPTWALRKFFNVPIEDPELKKEEDVPNK